MLRLSKPITALLAFLLPSPILRPALRGLGHRVSPTARIGLSFLWTDRLYLGENACIGHFNMIMSRRLLMRERAQIGRLNVLHGPISVNLARHAAIGNSNVIQRAPQGPVSVGPAMLRLGELTKITSHHRIDCTCSVHIGDFSVLAGADSQIWTHGYVHDLTGPGRYRIEGPVYIDHNVYVGARCIISLGVSIASGAIIGAGTTVAQSLDAAGLYVSAPIRRLPRPPDAASREDLVPMTHPDLQEIVYRRRLGVQAARPRPTA